MEKKIVENNIHATVFCSPHNPCGRVWERWELEKAMELFQKHDVMVVSRRDLVRHHPRRATGTSPLQMRQLRTPASRTVALYAPSKTFNLAGLIGSYHIIYNKALRDRVEKESLPVPLQLPERAVHARPGWRLHARRASDWVDELRQTITGNVDYACGFIAQHFPGVKVQKPQGTYMLFLDCTDWCEAHGKTIDQRAAGRLGRGRGLAGRPSPSTGPATSA